MYIFLSIPAATTVPSSDKISQPSGPDPVLASDDKLRKPNSESDSVVDPPIEPDQVEEVSNIGNY